MRVLNRIINRLKVSVADQLTRTLYQKGIPYSEIVKIPGAGSINFVLLGCEIPADYNPDFLINGYGYAKKLKETHDAKFLWNGKELHVQIKGINHHVQTEEDLFINATAVSPEVKDEA